MQIILAEDDDISRILLQVQLEQWGHSVLAAKNGRHAWELLQQNDCQVVITDWMMPEMTGIELLQKIRTSDRAGYVYVILLTSNSEKEALFTGLTSGADDFLTKPVDPYELQARLQPSRRIIELERRLAERNLELENRNQQLASTNARTKRDLDAAAKIQQAFLPDRIEEIPGVQFAWHYAPCSELAGDMLNILRLDDDHVGVYVLDVSGHGVQASLLAVTACRNLTTNKDASSVLWQRRDGTADYDLLSPAAAIEQLNSRFVAQSLGEQFFTIVYGIVNLRTGQFRYTVAGHPCPVHVSASGGSTLLPGTGLPVGIAELEYEEHTVQLEPGDSLVFYSDGLTERMNLTEDLFGNDRLLTSTRDLVDGAAENTLAEILDGVNNWAGDAPIHDDLSLIVLEYAPEQSRLGEFEEQFSIRLSPDRLLQTVN